MEDIEAQHEVTTLEMGTGDFAIAEFGFLLSQYQEQKEAGIKCPRSEIDALARALSECPDYYRFRFWELATDADF